MAKLFTRILFLLSILFLAGCTQRSDASLSHIAATPAHASSKIDIRMTGVDRSMTLSFLSVDGETFATLHSPSRTFYRSRFPVIVDDIEVTTAFRRKGKYIAKIENQKALVDALVTKNEHTIRIGIEEFTFTVPDLSDLLEESKKKHSTVLEF